MASWHSAEITPLFPITQPQHRQSHSNCLPLPSYLYRHRRWPSRMRVMPPIINALQPWFVLNCIWGRAWLLDYTSVINSRAMMVCISVQFIHGFDNYFMLVVILIDCKKLTITSACCWMHGANWNNFCIGSSPAAKLKLHLCLLHAKGAIHWFCKPF